MFEANLFDLIFCQKTRKLKIRQLTIYFCFQGFTLRELPELKTLHVSNCGLTSLEGLPEMVNLTELDLSDNNLSSGLDILVGYLFIWHF